MKRLYTILFAGLVGVSLVAADAAHAFADKGGAKRSSSASRVANTRSLATMNHGNNAAFKPQIQKQITDRTVQSLGNASLAGRNPANLRSSHLNPKLTYGALARKVISAPAVTNHAKLAATISKHSVATSYLAGVKFAPSHCHKPLSPSLWCHYYPKHCHWWWNYCGELHTCLPAQYCYWNWYYVSCPQVVFNGVLQPKCTWYLGVNGMVLPGSGLGIDSVAVGSPADLAGLRTGMVISSVNGIALTTEAEMQQAIASSGGLLNLIVIEAADREPIALTVQMALVTSVSY